MTTLKNIQKNKEFIRKEILIKLRSQKKEEHYKKSEVIRKKLFELEEFKKAGSVIFFVSMDEEVNTHQMIDESVRIGKVVGVPVVIQGKKDLVISQITDRIRQLEIGPYGIGQPKEAEIKPIPYNKMDLVLVPGVAFDKKGNRLGRGKGYYDRFLKNLPEHIPTIGLCFDFQILDSIPTSSNDIPVRMLLSNG